jgi:hypothetical protein
MQLNNSIINNNLRYVHARGYNDFYDIPYYIFHEINAALMVCHNCADYAFVFEKYSEMTDF